MGSNRLHVITRRDLKRGLKIAQACHVAFKSPKVLSFADEERLSNLRKQVEEKTKVVCFQESDLNNQLTAIAFFDNDGTKNLTEDLRLAG